MRLAIIATTLLLHTFFAAAYGAEITSKLMRRSNTCAVVSDPRRPLMHNGQAGVMNGDSTHVSNVINDQPDYKFIKGVSSAGIALTAEIHKGGDYAYFVRAVSDNENSAKQHQYMFQVTSNPKGKPTSRVVHWVYLVDSPDDCIFHFDPNIDYNTLEIYGMEVVPINRRH